MTNPRPQQDAVRDPGFGQFVWIWNVHQGRETPALHQILADWLDRRWSAGDTNLLLMVFRDAGKSTLAALFAAWLLVRNPDLRILILAAEHNLACKMTRNIRKILELHPLAQDLLPQRSDQWASDQFSVKRDLVQRDPSVLARGISGNITGTRADLIICDDVEVPNTSDTPIKREILRQRLRELSFILTPGGTQLYIGTPHSFYSIYADAPRTELGETEPFLAGFLRLTIPVVDDSGCSRWPERFDQATLENVRRQSGPNKYKSQMLLQPAHIAETRLDPDLLKAYTGQIRTVAANGRNLLTIDDEQMVASQCWWDPAFGHANAGDASVVAVVFQDRQGRYWLHDIEYIDVGKLNEGDDEATVSCVQVAAFLERNMQSRISIEVNGIGRFLPALLRKELHRVGRPAFVYEHVSTTSKISRILEAFDPVLAAKTLFVHKRVLESQFLQEMRDWLPNRQSRDDGLDAVSACLLALPVRQPYSRMDPMTTKPHWRKSSSSFKAHVEFSP
ncbi:MAG: phage terminase large subunit [Pseudomonadota bacterium]